MVCLSIWAVKQGRGDIHHLDLRQDVNILKGAVSVYAISLSALSRHVKCWQGQTPGYLHSTDAPLPVFSWGDTRNEVLFQASTWVKWVGVRGWSLPSDCVTSCVHFNLTLHCASLKSSTYLQPWVWQWWFHWRFHGLQRWRPPPRCYTDGSCSGWECDRRTHLGPPQTRCSP